MLDDLSLMLLAALSGLVVGSLLNTVIHRLPLMLEQQWAKGETGQAELEDVTPARPFNLWWPRSHCPHCRTTLGIVELIPLFSWLWQRGRCRHCQQPISARYPLVEGLTALAFVICLWRLPLDATLPLAWVVTSGLIALAFIDWETQYLPDALTLPLMWLGLLVSVGVEAGLIAPSTGPAPVSPTLAIVGASVGYLSLWSVYWLFKWVTGKEGMGYGDFKLLAALGAWLGPAALLPIILLASIAGTVVGVSKIFLLGGSRHEPLAFGPYLALAGWLVWLA